LGEGCRKSAPIPPDKQPETRRGGGAAGRTSTVVIER
jgi:hypothetical protein